MEISAHATPSTKKLLSLVIPHVATKWYELGAMLLNEEQEYKLKEIQSNFESHPDANWYILVEALQSPGVELGTIAFNIKKTFRGGKQQVQVKNPSADHVARKISFQEDYSEINFKEYDVSSAFSKLFTIIQKAIKNLDHDEFQMIRNSCVAQAKEPLCSLLKQAPDSHHLFEVLAVNKPYCNWMRINFLEVIANAYGKKSLEKLVKEYKGTIFSKPLHEVWGCISHISTKHKYYSELQGKFGVKDPENMTVEDLIKNEPQLAKEIELHIAEIQQGSLIATWLIPTVKLYQAYLSFLAVPQQSRVDVSLQFDTWVAYLPQLVLQEQQKEHGNIPVSTLLIGYYYGLLLRDVESDLLIDQMYSDNLLTTDEQNFITFGHNVHQKNRLLLEHVRHMDGQNLVVFCELLQNKWPQIGTQLLTALESSDKVLNTTVVGKPDLSMQEAEVESKKSICGQYYKPSAVNTEFLYLLDKIVELLNSFDYMLLVEQCEGMMASALHQINLFSNKQTKELSKCSNAQSVLWKLSMYLTWNNHYYLRELACFSDEAIKLLDEFDSKLDPSQPVAVYPVPQFSSNMIPTDHRVYTLLAVRCDQELYNCTLQYVYDMQSLLAKKCEITEHCLQLLAVRDNPTILYWTIPTCVVSIISSTCTVPQYSEFICSGGVLEALLYPNHQLIPGNVVSFGSLTFTDNDKISTSGEKVGVTYNSKIVKHQIELLQASDELIDNALKFQNSLSDLHKLYINKFKSKRQHSKTSVERNIIQIIKDVIGYADNTDADKEREEWMQYVAKIETTRDFIKEALYSQDTSKMADIQATLKLDSAEAKAAEEWSAVLEEAVALGNNSLVKLNGMRSQNNALTTCQSNVMITSVYGPINRCVKVSESYLEAWVKWIEQRIKL